MLCTRFVHNGREIRIQCERLGNACHGKRHYEITIAPRVHPQTTEFACSLFDLLGGLFRTADAAAAAVPEVKARIAYIAYDVNGPELTCEFEEAVEKAKRIASRYTPAP